MKREDIKVGGIYKCKNDVYQYLVKDIQYIDRRHTRRTITCRQVCDVKDNPGVYYYTGTTILLGFVQFSKWAIEECGIKDPNLGEVR